MSDFKFACPECGQHISGDESYRGQQVQCPQCQHSFVVPAEEPSRPQRPAPPLVRTPTKTAASRRWPTVLFWVGFAFVACVLLGLTLHRRSAPRRSLENLIGKNVVIPAPGAPDAHVLSTSDSSPLAKVRVQNPPGAITFVLELKKTVEEFYEEGAHVWEGWHLGDEINAEGTKLHFGVGRIYFDTDDNVKTGQYGPADGPGGSEWQLNNTLMAKSERGVSDWANAHVNVRKAQGHVLRCDLFRVQPGPGSGMVAVNPRSFLSRGKVDGKVMWITVRYSELGMSPGQSVRITFTDEGKHPNYYDGEALPSFRIQLQ
jgi:hypothetical protein